MESINFKGSNIILNKPNGMTEEECGSLPVFRGHEECMSCWELSDEDMEALKKDPKIWVWVYAGGATQPPIALSATNPFPKGTEFGEKLISDKPGQEQ